MPYEKLISVLLIAVLLIQRTVRYLADAIDTDIDVDTTINGDDIIPADKIITLTKALIIAPGATLLFTDS